jgi:hypothetical protein
MVELSAVQAHLIQRGKYDRTRKHELDNPNDHNYKNEDQTTILSNPATLGRWEEA